MVPPRVENPASGSTTDASVPATDGARPSWGDRPSSGPSPADGIASAAAHRADIVQFIEFKLAGQCYAFRIDQIREIVILETVTPVPQVAHYVDGVCNLRGAIIPIINLRALFGINNGDPDDETRTIVVNVGEKTMGCTVDSVTRVLKLRRQQIQTPPDTVTDDGASYITGLAKVDEHLVIILDVNLLLDLKTLHQIKPAHLSGLTPHGN